MIDKIFNNITQLIMNALVGNNQSTFSKRILYSCLAIIRDLILNYYDPDVEYNINGSKLLIPFSHELPIYLTKYDGYARNLEGLVNILASEIKELKIIEVGANVGDTITFIRKVTNSPILAIEPENRFFELLKINTANFKDISYENLYLGEKDMLTNMALKVKRGTAFLEKIDTNKSAFRKLDSVLVENKKFLNAKLLITDTDGYDFLVFKGAIKYLKRIKPVIFFEFDPNMLKGRNKLEGIRLFEFLNKLGYREAIFYDNFGKYMLSVNLSNAALIKDLSKYVLSNKRIFYYDVCVFHKSEYGLFNKVIHKLRLYG